MAYINYIHSINCFEIVSILIFACKCSSIVRLFYNRFVMNQIFYSILLTLKIAYHSLIHEPFNLLPDQIQNGGRLARKVDCRSGYELNWQFFFLIVTFFFSDYQFYFPMNNFSHYVINIYQTVLNKSWYTIFWFQLGIIFSQPLIIFSSCKLYYSTGKYLISMYNFLISTYKYFISTYNFY